MRLRIIRVVSKRCLILGHCRFPLTFVQEYLRLRQMGPRIVLLKGQSGVGEFVRAGHVSRRVPAPQVARAIVQSKRQADHGRFVLRIESQRPLVEVYHVAIHRLVVGA